MLEKTVNVRPRIWTSLPTQNARESPKWVNSIPNWGLYDGADPATLSAEAGGGPWKGSYYVSGTPSITAAVMYMHNDLNPGGPAYPIVDTIDAEMIEECGVSGHSISLYSPNDTCGYKSRVDDFRQAVIAHEAKHETSLNKCIERVNGRLGEIEAIVGNSFIKVSGDIGRLWTNALLNARETDQGPMFANIWHYRPDPGPWKYPVITVWHNGTDGCSHI